MGAELRIALLGLGTVGSGVLHILEANRSEIRKRLGRDIRVAGIAVRNPRKRRLVPVARPLVTTDPRALVVRPDVDVVVELIGGLEPATELVRAAIRAGKSVVTANKALLAERGDRVFAEAEERKVWLGFEAAVAGGIPIIRSLRDALSGDRSRELYGIVNGTCNSILSDMAERGMEFGEAVLKAQREGLAEADPLLDIDGTDSAHKLALLAMLAFRTRCPLEAIHREGIQAIHQLDVAFASELGYVIKLLAIAKDHGREIEARVHPTMIPKANLLGDVRGASNAVQVQGASLGATLYAGPGAGRLPTATAVVADLLEIARSPSSAPPPLGVPWRHLRQAQIRPIGDVESEYYLRFLVSDRPGVLARITGVLGRHEISIASVIQRGRGRRGSVPIVIRTHEAQESRLQRAMAQIGRLPAVRAEPGVIRIEDRLGVS